MGDRVAVMRDGVLQQVGTPEELYDRPAQPLRGRVHRLARDEPRDGRPRAERRRLSAAFGSHRLRLDPATLERHPGLSAYEGGRRRARDPARGHRGRGRAGRDRLGARPLGRVRHPRGHGLRGGRALQRGRRPRRDPRGRGGARGRGRRGRGGAARGGAGARRGCRVRRTARADDRGARAAAARGAGRCRRSSTSSTPRRVPGSARASMRRVSAR